MPINKILSNKKKSLCDKFWKQNFQLSKKIKNADNEL